MSLYLVEETVGNAVEPGEDDVDVVRQPQDAEHNHHQRNDATRLGRAFSGALLVDGSRTLWVDDWLLNAGWRWLDTAG